MSNLDDVIISAPIDLLETSLDTSTASGLRAQMFTCLENGTHRHMTEYPTLRVRLLGPPRELRHGDVLTAELLRWEITTEFVCFGIRVFGGCVEGRPWDKYAYFDHAPRLKPGNTLTASYKIHAVRYGDGDD